MIEITNYGFIKYLSSRTQLLSQLNRFPKITRDKLLPNAEKQLFFGLQTGQN